MLPDIFEFCFAIHIAYGVFSRGDVLQSSHFNKRENILQVNVFCLFVVIQCFLLFSRFYGFSLSQSVLCQPLHLYICKHLESFSLLMTSANHASTWNCQLEVLVLQNMSSPSTFNIFCVVLKHIAVCHTVKYVIHVTVQCMFVTGVCLMHRC